MDLIIESLNKIKLDVSTNDGDYEIEIQVDEQSIEPSTMCFSKDDINKVVSINMPFRGMILRKIESGAI